MAGSSSGWCPGWGLRVTARLQAAVVGGLAALLAAALAHAEIVIGVSISGTGPGASLGIPVRNAFEVLPKTIGGEPVRLVMVDDASDPAQGAKLVRQLAEQKVDVIIGSSTIPVAIAQGGIASELKIPIIALCPIPLDPVGRPVVFAVPQSPSLMVEGAVEHMKANGVKTVGFIGFADAWGDLTLKALQQFAEGAGIKILTNERFARTDTAVNAQVIKIMAASPEAVLVGGAGTPSAAPQTAFVERGYKGPIYHMHGVVNPDFIRVAGKTGEGAIAPTGAIVVAEQLPDGHPLKKTSLDFLAAYESKFGPKTRNAFAGYAYDAYALVTAAVPKALARAKAGTPEFRQALRDALAGSQNVVGTHAVYNLSATDHNGVDQRGRVMVRVTNGDWRLIR